LQDTITGFLLAGVGNVDLRRKSNFLIVDQSANPGRGAGAAAPGARRARARAAACALRHEPVAHAVGGRHTPSRDVCPHH
jgi:hypothetical protein